MRVGNDRMDTYLQVLFDELKRRFIKPILTALEFFNIRIVKQEVQAHFISCCFASLKIKSQNKYSKFVFCSKLRKMAY